MVNLEDVIINLKNYCYLTNRLFDFRDTSCEFFFSNFYALTSSGSVSE